MNKINSTYQTGEVLAFRLGGYGQPPYSLHKIDRITPSGRIICGHYELNPDLSIRGALGQGWSRIVCVGRVTAQITEEVTRYKLVTRLKRFEWNALSTDTLKAVEEMTKHL